LYATSHNRQVKYFNLNDEGWFETFNDSFTLDNQETAANDRFVSHNQQIDTDNDNYITDEEKETANKEDTIDFPLFSPISCVRDDELVGQQVISKVLRNISIFVPITMILIIKLTTNYLFIVYN